MPAYEYRYLLFKLSEYKPDEVLQNWATKGWRLHSSSTVALGMGYGTETFVHLIWERIQEADASGSG